MKKRNNILVIDDDEGILEGFSAILEEENYLVETASDADEVFKREKEAMPSLILLDVLLSGQDGRDVCRRLKTNKNTKNIPVIMVSARPNVQRSVKEAGADDFLAKPFEMDDLLGMISKYLS